MPSAGTSLIYEDFVLPTKLPVRCVTINNPAKRNCLTCADLRALRELSAGAPQSIFALMAASGAFCSGLDLNELIAAAKTDDGIASIIRELVETYTALTQHPQRTVSIVDGSAIGAGVGLALSFDFVVTTPVTYFELPQEPGRRPLVNTALPLVHRRTQYWSVGRIDASELISRGLVDFVENARPNDARILEFCQLTFDMNKSTTSAVDRRPLGAKEMSAVLAEACRPENIQLAKDFYLEMEAKKKNPPPKI